LNAEYTAMRSTIINLNKAEIMLPTPELVKSYIAAGLACTHLEVEGDGQHFNAVIVSPAFAGKRPIQRHQLVYAALGERMREEIHALSMKTLTPEEFQK
jgi:acid stress-induced BolA-like protein IbaG/YrbA